MFYSVFLNEYGQFVNIGFFFLFCGIDMSFRFSEADTVSMCQLPAVDMKFVPCAAEIGRNIGSSEFRREIFRVFYVIVICYTSIF